MADDFQAEVCGGSWWNSTRSMFGSSPCSSGIHDLGGFGWPNDLLDMKARSSDESGSASDCSIVIQDMHNRGQTDSAIDSSLQIMGIGLSSSTTTDWNRSFLHGNGRSETNYPPNPMLQEDHNSSMNYRQETGVDCPQIRKDWSLKNFSSIVEDSSLNSVNQDFSLDQKPLNSITSSTQSHTATCEGLSASFPISSVSYGYSSTLLQTLFDTDPQPPQQSLYGNRSMNYASAANYQTNLNEFSPSLAKFSPLPNSSLSKQLPTNLLNFSNNSNFCNSSAAALNDFRASTFPSQSQFLPSTFNDKTCLPNLTTKPRNEEVKGLSPVATKTSTEPAFKRPRIETPSPLPTFKVRKEKLGDRITALQQLVSPFGKTDTASVLHEAIEYIKFLHDQVLSTPYLKNGSHVHRQQTSDKGNNQGGPKQDLKGRGLCLVPISSTFPVAAETTTDFWTPTFGATFR